MKMLWVFWQILEKFWKISRKIEIFLKKIEKNLKKIWAKIFQKSSIRGKEKLKNFGKFSKNVNFFENGFLQISRER